MSSVVSTLLRWYQRDGRNLPWRTTVHPYHIFISEIMLQQTQVDRVIVFYRAWLKRFPSWSSLAKASTRDLIHAWAGLGYNRRALYAREAAQQILANGLPANETSWRRIKGVGPYMAAVLTEFINHQRALVIDTNIRRVVGRLHGILFPTPKDDPRIKRWLDRLTPSNKRHLTLPHAFMDLGALRCTATKPDCRTCPLQNFCKSSKKFLNGTAVRPPRAASREKIHVGKKFPDRIFRGRILSSIRMHGPSDLRTLASAVDPTFQSRKDLLWMQQICERLIRDGLLVKKDKNLFQLP